MRIAHTLRPLRLADAPALLVLMRRAEGGLGRLPDEMDLPGWKRPSPMR
jgi:hypothetical protein